MLNCFLFYFFPRSLESQIDLLKFLFYVDHFIMFNYYIYQYFVFNFQHHRVDIHLVSRLSSLTFIFFYLHISCERFYQHLVLTFFAGYCIAIHISLEVCCLNCKGFHFSSSNNFSYCPIKQRMHCLYTGWGGMPIN